MDVKNICWIVIVGTLLCACSKPELIPEENRTNLFDPNYSAEQWFQPTSMDSAHVGGIVYTYNLYFNHTNPDLIDQIYDGYDVVVKRIDSDIYVETPSSFSGFRIVMFNHDRVNGKFNCDIALRGENQTVISSSFHHVSQW